jgi:hypothetical protein
MRFGYMLMALVADRHARSPAAVSRPSADSRAAAFRGARPAASQCVPLVVWRRSDSGQASGASEVMARPRVTYQGLYQLAAAIVKATSALPWLRSSSCRGSASLRCVRISRISLKKYTKFGFSHAEWIELDLEWVEASEAVYRLPGASDGADQEVAHAESAESRSCTRSHRLKSGVVTSGAVVQSERSTLSIRQPASTAQPSAQSNTPRAQSEAAMPRRLRITCSRLLGCVGSRKRAERVPRSIQPTTGKKACRSLT